MNKDEFKYKDSLIQRLSSKSGLRGKINAHCVMCIYDPANGGFWRQQVGNCTVESCPLWGIRAKSSKADRMAESATLTEV